MKKVLELNHIEARQFFLKNESYVNFDLPAYFNFEDALKSISRKIDKKNIRDFYGSSYDADRDRNRPTLPCDYEGVNYKFLNNKDGKYAWRPFQIIHPALYVSLVQKITEQDNWKSITDRFDKFKKDERIKCFSIPLVSDTNLTDKAANITNWWESIEQKSIEYALKYDYILHIDLADCYGSIYTHSIPWALHTKKKAKDERNNKSLIGNIIDKHLQDMSYGQTNGIPQGSTLMDFLAEMVLGYADLTLSLKTKDLENFEIIRYRDDYRIFTNNPQDAELIVKILTEILVDLGLKLNTQKTLSSNQVIEDSIKPDKLYWLQNKRSNRSLQEHLLLIHNLAKKFPNSGTLVKALTAYFNRIKGIEETNQNINVLTSIIVDIAFKNPRTYQITTAILSKLFSLCGDDERQNLINLTQEKFTKIPNTGHLQVWLQRSVLKFDTEYQFEEKLCNQVIGNNTSIWNSDWLNSSFQELISNESFIDTEALDNMPEILESSEVELFGARSGNNY